MLWLPAGQVVGRIVSIPIQYVLRVSSTLSEIPLAAVYTDSVYIVVWLTFVYVLLIAFLCMKKRQPAILAGCIAVSLFASIAMTRLESVRDSYCVTVLDVGQGQSVLIQCKEKTFLVDCGGDTPEKAANTVSMYLLGRGITKLDGLVLTHYDTDHAGGVNALLSRFPVSTIYLPDIYDDNGLRAEIEEQNLDKIEWVRENIQLNLPEGMLSLYAGLQQEDDNESGLCVLFQAENCDILITGDRGFAGEAALMTCHKKLQFRQL